MNAILQDHLSRLDDRLAQLTKEFYAAQAASFKAASDADAAAAACKAIEERVDALITRMDDLRVVSQQFGG